MSTSTYPLARQGVYRSIQGEGALLGTPMVFVRLAGCSIGCPQCDTNYAVASRAEAASIADEALRLSPPGGWAWITGGEPADHELTGLIDELKGRDFKIAVATSGTRRQLPVGIDWISVSPHSSSRPAQWFGTEVKLVPGLNGLNLADCDPRDYLSFPYKFVQPMQNDSASLAACLAWVDAHPSWRLGIQAHRAWGLE